MVKINLSSSFFLYYPLFRGGCGGSSSRHRCSQNLDGGGANHKSHAMTSSETSKEKFFVGAKNIVEWKIRS